MKVMKKAGRPVIAYELGTDSPQITELIAQGKVRRLDGDTYEVFSLEAVNGGGEIARAGDFIKLDTSGAPYPVGRDFFLANHKHLSGSTYEQIPRELSAWTTSEPVTPEIAFLMERKGLVLDPADPRRYFTAPLWGTLESAASDAVIVLYSVTRNMDGEITDISFNFVARREFDDTYIVLS